GGQGIIDANSPTAGCIPPGPTTTDSFISNLVLTPGSPSTISYSVAANTTGVARKGVIHVDGLNYVVNQAAGPQTFGCTVNAPVAPTLRAEGLTELLPDLNVGCQSQGTTTPGDVVVTFNTTMTNPILLSVDPSGHTIDAVLLVDPGASVIPGANAFRGQI